MPKVAPITNRKDEHIRINLEEDVRSSLSTGLERYQIVHQALPEVDLQAVNSSRVLFGRRLAAPILISSMTGGTRDAGQINHRLAEAAQELRFAMGVGSQRAALEHPEQDVTFQVRKYAPDIPLFANLGAIQLNNGFGLDDCRRAVEMIEADALYLHLNPLQEAVQSGGNTNYAGLAARIAEICNKLGIPVIAKEVGWGISVKTARLLIDCGVAAIDVAGAGGTSWSQVEMHRAPDEFTRELAAAFVGWGISTADSILNVQQVDARVQVFASGGIRDGLDIAKSIALGASMAGMAGNFLKAAAISSERVIEVGRLITQQLRVAMFAAGATTLQDLNREKLFQVEP